MRVCVGVTLSVTAWGPSAHRQPLGVETRPGEIAIDQEDIERSEAPNAWEGTTYYGTIAESGVILVYTKTGQDS